jgi:hypothetical protein
LPTDIPARLRSAPSVSHALDGFLLHVPCRLISSRYRVQGFASGVSSLEPAATPRRCLVSSRRWRRAPTGVATSASSRRVDLRVLIRSEIRNHRGGVSPADDPYPLLRPAPSGSASKVLVTSLLPPPLATSAYGAHSAPSVDPQRLPTSDPSFYPTKNNP